jgi:hypothetical protein
VTTQVGPCRKWLESLWPYSRGLRYEPFSRKMYWAIYKSSRSEGCVDVRKSLNFPRGSQQLLKFARSARCAHSNCDSCPGRFLCGDDVTVRNSYLARMAEGLRSVKQWNVRARRKKGMHSATIQVYLLLNSFLWGEQGHGRFIDLISYCT